jgi:hypothetical protein
MESQIIKVINQLYELGQFAPRFGDDGQVFIPGEDLMDEFGAMEHRVGVNALLRNGFPKEIASVVGICKKGGQLIKDPVERKNRISEWVNYMQTRKAEEGITALKGVKKSSEDLIDWGLRPRDDLQGLYRQGFTIMKLDNGATYAGFGIPVETYNTICEVPVFDDDYNYLYSQTAVDNSIGILDSASGGFQYAYIPVCTLDPADSKNLIIRFNNEERDKFLAENNLTPSTNINFKNAQGKILFDTSVIINILDRAVTIYDSPEEKIVYQTIAEGFGMPSGFNFKAFRNFMNRLTARINLNPPINMKPVYI